MATFDRTARHFSAGFETHGGLYWLALGPADHQLHLLEPASAERLLAGDPTAIVDDFGLKFFDRGIDEDLIPLAPEALPAVLAGLRLLGPATGARRVEIAVA
ncbi:MAG: hypothetical protein KGN16_20065 [Burkholderiales bacterium]|nr:hypothetical protein [Burkholderiales bacterium]